MSNFETEKERLGIKKEVLLHLIATGNENGHILPLRKAKDYWMMIGNDWTRSTVNIVYKT